MQGTTGAAPALTTGISEEAPDQLFREARTFRATAPEAKEPLRPALAPNNIEKTMTAPVTGFFEKFPKLFPQADARSWFAGNQALIDETAFRNSSLQGEYFTLAGRALGIDCGPMSGFDAAMVNAEFFSDGRWKANFLCNLGHGDRSKLLPRNPRLEFEEACLVLWAMPNPAVI